MFNQILVPLDLHHDTEGQLELARTIALHTGGVVILAHYAGEGASEADLVEASATLRTIADGLVEDGIQVEVEVRDTYPDLGILVTSEHAHAGIVILAPHARAPLDTLLHPSLTAGLLSYGQTPLLITPERDKPAAGEDAKRHELLNPITSMVIAPLDGSARAEAAITVASAIAEEWRRPLLLLRVAEPLRLYGAGPDVMQLERDAQSSVSRTIHNELHTLRERLAPTISVPIEMMVKFGEDPSEVICETAARAPGSLVVMRTHGRGSVRRALLGSVAMGVVRKGRHYTLVLPPESINHLEQFTEAHTGTQSATLSEAPTEA